MDTTVKLDIVNSCRICLFEKATIPIFESSAEDTDVNSKICLCLGEKIEDKDGFPRTICSKCYFTVNDMVALINQYKESCKFLSILEAKKCIKEERTFPDSEPDFLDEPEIDIIIDDMKIEPKIFFNDAEQFEELIKPLVKKIKKEPKEKKKKTVKRTPKKTDALSRKSGKVASAILEGNFVFNGEQWCLASNQAYNIKAEFEPEVKKERILQPENEKEAVEKAKKKFKKKVHFPPVVKEKQVKQPSNKLCELCGEVFSNRDKLKRHTDRVHGEKSPVPCPICNKILFNNDSRRRHILRKHTNEKKFICSTCGRGFAFQGELNKHVKKVHLKIEIKRKRYPCNLCDKDFSTAKCLLMHERSAHTGERPAVCEVCGASFYHDDYLKEHMRLHTGETPYKCPVCARGYAQRCNMKSHIKHVHRLSQLDEFSLKTIHQRYLRLMKP